MSIAVFIVRD